MKQLRYVVFAAALVSGAVFAQSAMQAGQSGFVLSERSIEMPVQVAAAQALRGLTGMVDAKQALPPGFPLAIGSADALKQVHLGWGFAVNDVRPGLLKAGMPLGRAAQASGQWRYALISHGKPVGLVTLERGAHGWQVVSFGGAGLSQDIQTIIDQYGGKAHAQLRYIRVPQAAADFIEVRQGKGPARYAPLRAARSSLQQTVTRQGLFSAAELAPGLRAATARNVAVMH